MASVLEKVKTTTNKTYGHRNGPKLRPNSCSHRSSATVVDPRPSVQHCQNPRILVLPPLKRCIFFLFRLSGMMVFVNFPIRGNGLSNTITEPEVTKKKSMLNCLESIWVYLLFAKSIVQLWMLQFQRKYMVCEYVAWSFKLQWWFSVTRFDN